MILAAADYAFGKTKRPPSELSIIFECHMWGTIPKGTSLDDIPMGLRSRTRVAMSIYNAIKQYRAVGAWKSEEARARWYNDNTDILELLDWIEEMRDSDGR